MKKGGFPRQDIAADVLGIVLLALLFLNHFLFTTATGRIGNKVGVTASEGLGPFFLPLLAGTIVLLLLLVIKGSNEKLNFAAGLLASILFGFTVFAAGRSYAYVDLPESGRVSMSIGCYAFLVTLYLVEVKCCEYLRTSLERGLVTGIGLALTAILLLSGQLSELGIMKEYANSKQKFWNAFRLHVQMSFKVVLWSLILGIPLGWISYKNETVGKVISVILSAVEAIPTMALIALMMFPLAYLNNNFAWARAMGISGIGKTPVFVALLLYVLFRIVNSVYGAFKLVNQEYIENARGLGMTTMQIFTKVELPIALPVIISGIRVAIIASISLTSIGAYMGYGGLGIFVVNGMPVFSIDMVLLGTIPIMIMIFFFDFVFRKLVEGMDTLRVRKASVAI